MTAAALLFWLWQLSAGAACGGNVAKLDAADWDARERAERRLRDAGAFAYPVLLAGCGSPRPEVAFRCRVLAGPWQRCHLRARAYWVLLAPPALGPEPREFADDLDLRLTVRAVALSLGCDAEDVWGLEADEVSDLVTRWWCSIPYWWDPCKALDRCRGRVWVRYFPDDEKRKR